MSSYWACIRRGYWVLMDGGRQCASAARENNRWLWEVMGGVAAGSSPNLDAAMLAAGRARRALVCPPVPAEA
jgi:hypothetical protein